MYRTWHCSSFLYQLRVNEAKIPLKVKYLVLDPLGWQVSYSWNSTSLTYDFTA